MFKFYYFTNFLYDFHVNIKKGENRTNEKLSFKQRNYLFIFNLIKKEICVIILENLIICLSLKIFASNVAMI